MGGYKLNIQKQSFSIPNMFLVQIIPFCEPSILDILNTLFKVFFHSEVGSSHFYNFLWTVYVSSFLALDYQVIWIIFGSFIFYFSNYLITLKGFGKNCLSLDSSLIQLNALPQPGGSVGWSIIPYTKRSGFDLWSGWV